MPRARCRAGTATSSKRTTCASSTPPSGTALTLGAAAAQGGASPRYASIRAGDIVGEHLVQFATAGERIELVHRASNRDIFARGALHVARAIHGRAAGRHRIADLL